MSEEKSRTSNLAREWSRHHRSILAFIGSLVHGFAEAEELLQETASQVFEHVDRYDTSRPFFPYACGIAKNVVLLHRRRSARNPVIFDQDIVDQLVDAFSEISEEGTGVSEALKHCRSKLNSHFRKVCRMRYEEGLGSAEIAHRLGTTGETIRVLLFRVRKQLRECIGKRLELDGRSAR